MALFTPGQQPKWIDEFSRKRSLGKDFRFARLITNPQALQPGLPSWEIAILPGECKQKAAGVTPNANIRPAVHTQVFATAVDGYQRGTAPYVAPVIQPKVAGYAGKHDQVGFLESISPFVAQM